MDYEMIQCHFWVWGPSFVEILKFFGKLQCLLKH